VKVNDVTERIIGAAIEVHKALGPGLLESAYEECLCHELSLLGVDFVRQLKLPVKYKGIELDVGYRLDLYINSCVIVELKSVDKLTPIHDAQLLTYLRLLNCKTGLLINFNDPVLKQGLRRKVLNYYE
jgi:GxxExxY protein